MSGFRAWLSPSGGLSYHLSALAYRHSLWQPFVATVDKWLNTTWLAHEVPSSRQAHRQTQLIIFGASAGWTLSSRFIQRFQNVLIVEPDPVARWLFTRRFPHTESEARHDLLPWFYPASSPDRFDEFLKAHPDAVILFSNLLGQIPLLLKGTTVLSKELTTRTRFLNALEGRTWASYHDLFSAHGFCRPTPHLHFQKSDCSDRTSLEDRLIGSFGFEHVHGAPHDKINVIDHETLWLSEFSEITHCTFWNLRPGDHHLIGFTHSP